MHKKNKEESLEEAREIMLNTLDVLKQDKELIKMLELGVASGLEKYKDEILIAAAFFKAEKKPLYNFLKEFLKIKTDFYDNFSLFFDYTIKPAYEERVHEIEERRMGIDYAKKNFLFWNIFLSILVIVYFSFGIQKKLFMAEIISKIYFNTFLLYLFTQSVFLITMKDGIKNINFSKFDVLLSMFSGIFAFPISFVAPGIKVIYDVIMLGINYLNKDKES